MSPTQVLVSDLSQRYRSAPVLSDINLMLEGGVVAVLGPNGSGKTTLLRCLATVAVPSEGSILLDGLNPRHEPDRVEIRRRLGYLPQNADFERSVRAFDVLDYMACLKLHHDDRHRRQLVFTALSRVGLADKASVPVRELSGGMQQRLGVAQAIIGQPSLLVLDEPAVGLDPDERFRLRDILSNLRHRATVVVSTHLTDEAAEADIILVLIEGALKFVGSPTALAQTATGRAWVQTEPPVGVRASWRQADGSYRCLGWPPPGAQPIDPTLEDGYLLLTGT